MGWIGLVMNVGKIVGGAMEGDIVKVGTSSCKAVGHLASGIAGPIFGDEIKERIDEALENVEEADSD